MTGTLELTDGSRHQDTKIMTFKRKDKGCPKLAGDEGKTRVSEAAPEYKKWTCNTLRAST